MPRETTELPDAHSSTFLLNRITITITIFYFRATQPPHCLTPPPRASAVRGLPSALRAPSGGWGICLPADAFVICLSLLAATVQGTPARKFSGFHPVNICGVIVRADVGVIDRIVGGEGARVPAVRAVAAFETVLDLAQQPQHNALRVVIGVEIGMKRGAHVSADGLELGAMRVPTEKPILGPTHAQPTSRPRAKPERNRPPVDR